jgi:phosphate transport system substrate-binding protein
VAAQFEQQGITPVFITGFGQQLPVADNGTPEGRERNRRVEVWLRK